MSDDFQAILRTHAESMNSEGFYTVANALERAAEQIQELHRWRERECETQEALQAIGEEFRVRGGEPRVDGIRRVLTEQRDQLAALLREAGGWRPKHGDQVEHKATWAQGTVAGEVRPCVQVLFSDGSSAVVALHSLRPLPAPPAAGGKDGEV